MPDEEITTTEEPTTEEPTTEEPTENTEDSTTWTMLDDVKLALRLTTDAYNTELNALINAGLGDLGVAGVEKQEMAEGEEPTDDPLVKLAVITYCKIHFGSPIDFDRLKKSYDEQKAQLQTCTGYTNWGDS